MAGKPNIRRNKFNIVDKNVSPKNRGIIKKGDARLKIIQKTRSKLVDARDRLAQMAKKTDARAKILKLRQLRTTGTNSLSTSSESVRSVGSSILLKTDRNGKISLSTNKVNKNKSPADINTAIRKELGLVSNQRKMVSPKSQMVRQIQRSAPSFRSPLNSNRYDMTESYAPPPVIKRTIRNDIIRELPPLPDFSQPRIDQNLYTWVRPMPRAMPEPRKPLAMDSRPSVEVTARNNIMMDRMDQPDDWSYADPSVRSFKMQSMFVDDDEIERSPPRNMTSAQRMKTGVHARLDTPPTSGQSQGIFAHPKTKVVVPVGHRIVVSNLQATVTQDDIRELFEDIGELLVSRLVRPGTAEVIYKNLKDAQKAVDTYHNRQLDGQPMKCLLVNKRPVNNPTAPAVRTTKSTMSVLRTSGGITKKTITSSKSSSNKLVPDISTIHKVLFHKT